MDGLIDDGKLAGVAQVRNFLKYIVQFAFDHENCLLDSFAIGGESLVRFYVSGSQFYCTYTSGGRLKERELVLGWDEFMAWVLDHSHAIVRKDGSDFCYVYPTEEKD